MMLIVRNFFAGLCISACILLVSSSTGRAQVLAGSGDVSGYGGLVHTEGTNHALFGGSGGWNLVPAVSVFGEYTYVSTNSSTCINTGGVQHTEAHPETQVCASASSHVQLYGGGARFNFLTSTKIVPYAVAAFGGGNYSGGGGNGYYFGLGGGASWFLGKNWGIRPEYRYVRLEDGSVGANSSAITGGVFYQFGGHGTPKK
jgi:opacity protein-like surface antigen